MVGVLKSTSRQRDMANDESSKTNDCNANGIPRVKEEEYDCVFIVKPRTSTKDICETTIDRIRATLDQFKLTENDVRDALWDFVLHKKCYSRIPVIEMDILNIECTSVYRYVLETCVEQPQTKWITEPYDGAEGPLPPAPIPPMQHVTGQDSSSSTSGYQRIAIPRSATVKPCQGCSGRGVKPCVHCICTGRARCPFCQNHSFHHDGVGHLHSSRCLHCSGFSYLPCPYCKGQGHTTCGKCQGKGKLKSYLQLKMASKTIVSDLIFPTNTDGLPNQESLPVDASLLKMANGICIYEDESIEGGVQPIHSIPSAAIVERISGRLLRQHEFSYPGGKVKMQKHKVIAIPIAKIEAEYKKSTKTFYIYGQQRTVSFKDYFSKCVFCCSNQCSVM